MPKSPIIRSGSRRPRTARCSASSNIRRTGERLAALERQRASADDGSGHAAAFDRGSPRHPGFHKTSSVDYAIVLSGEIYALMDEGEVLLEAGDVLIQRGTNHAWSNRSDEPAYLAFVLVDAERYKCPPAMTIEAGGGRRAIA